MDDCDCDGMGLGLTAALVTWRPRCYTRGSRTCAWLRERADTARTVVSNTNFSASTTWSMPGSRP